MSSRKLLMAAAAIAFGLGAAEASATPVQAITTADNFYLMYRGPLAPNAASDLVQVGRNETTHDHQDHAFNFPGCTGAYNWSCPELINFEIAGDETIYMVVWDDGTVAESWIGQFLVGGTTYLSNLTDWEFFRTDIPNPALADPGTGAGADPALADIYDNILDANDTGDGDGWVQPPFSRGPNGSQPWGDVTQIDDNALFLSSLASASASNDRVTIYRLEFAPAPEPATLGVLGVGLFAMGLTRLRRRA